MLLRKHPWLDVFAHASAAGTVSLILIHQSIIAASSYFLTRLIAAFQQGENYREYLFLYLVAMLIPYLPGCMSLVTLQIWINNAHHRLVNRLADAAYGLTYKHRDTELQDVVESVSARNSFIAVKDYLTFVHGFVGFLLNSSLSMIVLGFLLPGNLLAGYVVSLLLCATAILLIRGLVGARSAALETRFISYSDALSGIWDNAALGNKYNFGFWSKSKENIADQYYGESNRLQLLKQCGNLMLAGASLGPTIYLVAHAVQDNSTHPALIAAIIVNLTRVFHILNSLSALVYQLLDWSSMNARLRVLFDAERKLSEASPSRASPSGEILLNGIQVHDFHDAATMLRNETHGRFTIRGGNGAGKSTLLFSLKQSFSDDAILVPAHHGKLYWDLNYRNMSTGQRTMAQLQELSRQADVKYLLLDEWDANLDIANTRDVDKMLDEISHQKVVVEIRH